MVCGSLPGRLESRRRTKKIRTPLLEVLEDLQARGVPVDRLDPALIDFPGAAFRLLCPGLCYLLV
jgi:hypothetical protein